MRHLLKKRGIQSLVISLMRIFLPLKLNSLANGESKLTSRRAFPMKVSNLSSTSARFETYLLFTSLSRSAIWALS